MHVFSDGKLGIHSLPCVDEAGGGAIAVLVGHSYIIRAMVWQWDSWDQHHKTTIEKRVTATGSQTCKIIRLTGQMK